jgi:hypothetical protein
MDHHINNQAAIVVPYAANKNVNMTQYKVHNLLFWISHVSSSHNKIKQLELSHYFSPNIKYQINGHLLANNDYSLLERFNRLIDSKDKMAIKFPVDGIVIAGHQVNIQYDLVVVPYQGKAYTDVIATTIMFNNRYQVQSWDATLARKSET